MLDCTRAVYFDLDGTLADTVPLILAAHAHTLARHLRGPGPPREVILGNMGRSLTDALVEYARADGQPDPTEAGAAMLATYRAFQQERHTALTRGYEGVRETVEAIAARGYLLAVVTSKVEWMARLTLEDVGLARWFDLGVFHDDTGRHKPHPDPLLAAAARTGIDPAATVYVGDSIYDIASGRAAGMKTVAVLWGPSSRATLEAAGPDLIADRPADLLGWLPLAPAEPPGCCR